MATPVNYLMLRQLLIEASYDEDETAFLTQGFETGFDLNYKRPIDRKDLSENIPFTVGDKFELWDKLMQEIVLGRVAEPFETVPFENFVQSPIGLVPKMGGKTRMIFHFSYKFKNGNESINHWIPKSQCSVHYHDLDHTVKNVLELNRQVQAMHGGTGSHIFGKTDLQSAFRVLCMSKNSWCWLIMMAKHPITGKKIFFVDKCLPFGSSISCAHFQQLSNALKAIVEFRTQQYNSLTNYLDDFLFAHFI